MAKAGVMSGSILTGFSLDFYFILTSHSVFAAFPKKIAIRYYRDSLT